LWTNSKTCLKLRVLRSLATNVCALQLLNSEGHRVVSPHVTAELRVVTTASAIIVAIPVQFVHTVKKRACTKKNAQKYKTHNRPHGRSINNDYAVQSTKPVAILQAVAATRTTGACMAGLLAGWLAGSPPTYLAALGRDSPIVKHYSSIKNSCFVTCVNSAFCS
jgi:hypothetical protein